MLRAACAVCILSLFVSAINAQTTDPWIVEQRIALYEDLIRASDIPRWFKNGNDSGNLVWGLLLQFEWQNRSGRIEQVPTVNGSVINTTDWWACMNYHLSVVPFLGAIAAGLVPPREIKPPVGNDPTKFCFNSSICDNEIAAWQNFFIQLQNSSDQNSTGPEVRSFVTCPNFGLFFSFVLLFSVAHTNSYFLFSGNASCYLSLYSHAPRTLSCSPTGPLTRPRSTPLCRSSRRS
jgi:hypothetical protein